MILVLIYFMTEARNVLKDISVSIMSVCLYSFTRVKYKQTEHFIDIRSIQEDPITLSIYVIAARGEPNLKLKLFNPARAWFTNSGLIKLSDFLQRQQQISFQIAKARNYTKKEFSVSLHPPNIHKSWKVGKLASLH